MFIYFLDGVFLGLKVVEEIIKGKIYSLYENFKSLCKTDLNLKIELNKKWEGIFLVIMIKG